MPSHMHAPVTHVLWDMDGLLLDTERLYTVAQQKVLDPFGKTFTWELKAKMMGRKALDAATLLVEELGLEGQLSAEDFVAQREVLLDHLFLNSELMPGVERLVRHLHAHGVPQAVATSSHRRLYDLKTTQHRALFALFDHVVTGDEVSAGKPAPDIFLTAAGRWARTPQPGSVLVFEDAPLGVEAAHRAGMRAVLVPDANLDPALYAAADAVVRSLEEFDPTAWGLPPF